MPPETDRTDAQKVTDLEGELADSQAAVARMEAAAIVSDRRILDLVAEVEQMVSAMDSRAAIEQAKGVLMHTMGINADAAFALLVAQSQSENRKLREIAEEIASRQDRA